MFLLNRIDGFDRTLKFRVIVISSIAHIAEVYPQSYHRSSANECDLLVTSVQPKALEKAIHVLRCV